NWVSLNQEEIHYSTYPTLTRPRVITQHGVPQQDIAHSGNPAWHGWLVKSGKPTSRDGRTWTFALRTGVKSPYGNELTAEDVKFTFDRNWHLGSAGKFHLQVAQADGPDALQVADKYRFTYRTSTPDPPLLLAALNLKNGWGIVDSTFVKQKAAKSDPWG